MYLVAGKPSEEVSEHQSIAFQVADDWFDTVSSVLLFGVGFAASAPLASDMDFGEEGAPLCQPSCPVGDFA